MKTDPSTSGLIGLFEFFRAGFSLFTKDSTSDEDEGTLMSRAKLLYRAMELIYEKRKNHLQHQPISKAEFEDWFAGLDSPMNDVYKQVFAQNLFEEIEDLLWITDQGREYEERYWASFR